MSHDLNTVRKIPATMTLYRTLMLSQAENLNQSLTNLVKYGLSDDGEDYLTSSLELMSNLVAKQNSDHTEEEALKYLDLILNSWGALIDNYACDGIADAFSELNCAGSHPEDDRPEDHPLNAYSVDADDFNF